MNDESLRAKSRNLAKAHGIDPYFIIQSFFLEYIATSENLLRLWDQYCEKNMYAAKVQFSQTVDSIQEIFYNVKFEKT